MKRSKVGTKEEVKAQKKKAPRKLVMTDSDVDELIRQCTNGQGLPGRRGSFLTGKPRKMVYDEGSNSWIPVPNGQPVNAATLKSLGGGADSYTLERQRV